MPGEGERKLARYKLVETPFNREVWEFDWAAPPDFSTDDGGKETEEGDADALSCSALYDAERRRLRHLREARWEVARIIEVNALEGMSFLTLTFREDVRDLSEANRLFKLFVKRLRYRLRKKGRGRGEFGYLAVWERTRAGRIHYHLVAFGLGYFPKAELEEVWGHGFVRINMLEVDRASNVARYISKYFLKAAEGAASAGDHVKLWFCSRGLKRPESSTWFDAPIDDAAVRESWGGGPVYYREYVQMVPKRDGTVEPHKVRYWKLAKNVSMDALRRDQLPPDSCEQG